MTCNNNRRKTVKTAASLLSRFRFSETDSLVAAQRELQNRLNTDRIVRKKTSLRRNKSDDSVECLHCDGVMKIYRRPSGDQWACCPRCGYANDVPGLLAAALHCSYREALDFLVFQHNLHHVDAKEIDELVHRRERYDRFVSLLRERLYHNYAPTNTDAGHHLNVVALEKLLDRLDLLQYIDDGVNLVPNLLGKDERINDSKGEPSRDVPPNWQSPLWHATDFFGVEHYRKIESWFYPNLVDATTGRIKPNTSPNRLFHGLGWDLVLVIPLQDVPGRFCGVLCIGREGRFFKDYVLRLFGDESATRTNPGFILPFRSFQSMIRGEDHGLSRLLAYNNPLHLVRCLLRNGRDFLPSVPLFGWIDHFEPAPHIASSDWRPFRSVRDKTFWIQRDDPITLRSIVEQDGKIVQYDMASPYPGIREVSAQPFRPESTVLLKMLDDSVPWQRYLARDISSMTTASAVATLQRIAVTKERFRTVLEQLPTSKKVAEIRKQLQRPTEPETVQVGRYKVHVERAGLFRRTERQEQPVFVSDAVCRLDCQFCDSRRHKKIYRGRIEYAGQTIRFEKPLTEFKRRPIETVRSAIQATNLPEPTFRCKDRFYRQAVNAMSRLKTVRPIHAVGWNGKTKSIELPQLRITKRGIIPLPNRVRTVPENFPAREIDPSVFDEIPQLSALSMDKSPMLETAVPFLVVCSLVALRPIAGLEEKPLFFSEGNPLVLEHLAKAVGIPVAHLESETDVRNILRYNALHRWPILVFNAFEPETMFIRQMNREKSRHAVFHLADADKSQKAARFHSNLPSIRLPQLNGLDENYWQDRLPFFRSLFFDRMRHYVQQPKALRSPRTFLQRECPLWTERLSTRSEPDE